MTTLSAQRPAEKTRNEATAAYEARSREYCLQRLVDFLATDYEKLRSYLGDVRFNDMTAGLMAEHATEQLGARWYSLNLPPYLATASQFHNRPEIAELALLEHSLKEAFDSPVVDFVPDEGLTPAECRHLRDAFLEIAPSVHRFSVTTNVSSLWASLRCGIAPPTPEVLIVPAEIMVWRQGNGSRFRILGAEEAKAIDDARLGLTFGALLDRMAAWDSPEDAELRACGYLRGWLEAEIVSSIRFAGDTAK